MKKRQEVIAQIRLVFFDYHVKKGAMIMGLVIIFALITILGAFGTISTLKNKNILGLVFAAGTLVVFGWFTIMTLVNSGFPTVH
jgi:uncharacterized membrane protein YjgN (DUF898 family)